MWRISISIGEAKRKPDAKGGIRRRPWASQRLAGSA
jgi:hypothetical protein